MTLVHFGPEELASSSAAAGDGIESAGRTKLAGTRKRRKSLKTDMAGFCDARERLPRRKRMNSKKKRAED